MRPQLILAQVPLALLVSWSAAAQSAPSVGEIVQSADGTLSAPFKHKPLCMVVGGQQEQRCHDAVVDTRDGSVVSLDGKWRPEVVSTGNSKEIRRARLMVKPQPGIAASVHPIRPAGPLVPGTPIPNQPKVPPEKPAVP